MRDFYFLILLALSQSLFTDFSCLAQVKTGNVDLGIPDLRIRPSVKTERNREEIIAQGIEQFKKATELENTDPVNAYRNYIFASYNYQKDAQKKYKKLEKSLTKEQIGDVAYEVASILADTMNGFVKLREINALKTLNLNQMYKQKNEWLEIAVKNNNTQAMLEFAEVKSNTRKDGQAIKLLEKAAELGNLDANYQLALRYLYGNGVDKDKEYSRELFEKAAKLNHEASKSALTSIHYFPEIMAEQGNRDAQYIVATNLFREAVRNIIDTRYAAKNRSPEIFAKSLYWFDKAAEQGSGYAMHFLAMYNYYGLGTERNEALFANWMTKAAQADFEPAKVNMGYLIENGIRIQKSGLKAMEIYTKNADEGVVSAQSILGRIYKRGNEFVGKDLEKSLYWLKKAADQNDKVSQYLLCTYYSEGPEQVRDYVEAAKWLRIFTSGKDVYLSGPEGIMLYIPELMKSVKIIETEITKEQIKDIIKIANEWIISHPVDEQSQYSRNYFDIYRDVDFHVW